MAKRGNTHLTIARNIRNDIISGAIKFGDRLAIDEIATRYNSSHMPVREALRQLEGEGVVLIEPNRGARVRAVNTQFVSEMMDMRSDIEAQLARRAADRATALHVQQLSEVQHSMEANIAEEQFEKALDDNRKFHDLINAIADSSYPPHLINGHWLLLAALWHQYGYGPDRYAGVISDHRHLIVALRNGDGRAAETIMAAHVMKSKLHLIGEMEKLRKSGANTAVNRSVASS